MVVSHFSIGHIIKGRKKDSLIYTQFSMIIYCHNHSFIAVLSLDQCLQRTSDCQGANRVQKTGLDERGQTVSKQDFRVAQRVSVAPLASSDEN